MVIDRDDPDVLLPLPPTFEVHRRSAPAGKGHYYYRLADGIAEADVPRTFAAGEVRVAGSGHVVGPGCRHASGDLYEGNGLPVADADRELIDALKALPPVRRSTNGAVEAVIGSRHAFLTNMARKYRGWGWDLDRIVERLREDNETVCTPPLSDREFVDVERAAAWAIANVEPDRPVRLSKRRRALAVRDALR
jgi:hypothetical protein